LRTLDPMAVIIIPEALLQATIDGCLASDRLSQKRLYLHFYGYGMAVCSRYVSSHTDALGVLNDGFLKVFTELNRFKPRHQNLEGSLKAWIRRILVNTAIDYLRRQKHQPHLYDNLEALPTVDAQADVAVEKMSYAYLLGLVAKLSPAYRMVFNLFVIDGYSHEEISKTLNINVGTSKSNLAKAKMNLQRMIMTEKKTDHYAKEAV
jgi:RNA polymerase sigma factor (sigma-70 family)